jgi:hypothetical protein
VFGQPLLTADYISSETFTDCLTVSENLKSHWWNLKVPFQIKFLLWWTFSESGPRSRDSSVGIATGYGLDGRGVVARVPVGARIFYSPRRPDRFWGHPASYPMGTGGGGTFFGSKAAGAWNWPLTSNQCRDPEYMDLYIHSPIRLHGTVKQRSRSPRGDLLSRCTQTQCVSMEGVRYCLVALCFHSEETRRYMEGEEVPHYLSSSRNMIKAIKLERMGWAGTWSTHEGRWERYTKVYSETPKMKKQLVMSTHTRDENTELDLK